MKRYYFELTMEGVEPVRVAYITLDELKSDYSTATERFKKIVKVKVRRACDDTIYAIIPLYHLLDMTQELLDDRIYEEEIKEQYDESWDKLLPEDIEASTTWDEGEDYGDEDGDVDLSDDWAEDDDEFPF